MKKTLRLVALMLVLVIGVLTLASCSTYPKVKKAFEKEGFVESEKVESAFSSVLEAAGKDDAVVKTHVLSKGIMFALVIEFNATDDIVDFYKNNESAQSFVKDVKDNEDVQAMYNALHEAGFASGSCLVLPIDITGTVQNIVKNIK